MNRKNTIIEHYKNFFDLHAKGVALDEDDHLNIDWADDLVKNCFITDVVKPFFCADEKQNGSNQRCEKQCDSGCKD